MQAAPGQPVHKDGDGRLPLFAGLGGGDCEGVGEFVPARSGGPLQDDCRGDEALSQRGQVDGVAGDDAPEGAVCRSREQGSAEVRDGPGCLGERDPGAGARGQRGEWVRGELGSGCLRHDLSLVVDTGPRAVSRDLWTTSFPAAGRTTRRGRHVGSRLERSDGRVTPGRGGGRPCSRTR
jgi:hypothetical protein